MNNKSSKYRGEESQTSIKTLKVPLKDYTLPEFRKERDTKLVSEIANN
jgi:hypothetical protein